MMVYLLLIIGFVLLIKGADYFVDGCSSVAKLLKVPTVIIGLTIVSIGTSAPEAAVSITASTLGKNSLAVSNIIGSNLFNLLVVIGICAIICPFEIDRTIFKRDMPINILATITLAVMLADKKINLLEGIILFASFSAYIAVLIHSAIKERTKEQETKTLSPILSIVFILCGTTAIIAGGQLTVNSASQIAKIFGMSDTLIGLTVVAVGTSLPELVTSIVAAHKGESGLALGNAVGSCIFNVLFILGISAVISPLGTNLEAMVDSIALIGVCLMMYIFCITGKKAVRREGIVCVAVYIAYMTFTIYRNYYM